MIPKNGYFYDGQLRSYVLQFMAIFSGLQVQVGKLNEEDERLISVPIHYGSQDRVVASIIADNTQNKVLRLPVMSAYLRNIRLAPERMHGTGVERRQTYVPTGGILPDDVQVIHQRMPIPYTIEMELAIYVSNTNQHFQILEQILPLFEPQLTIQTSDAVFDNTRISSVFLTSSNIETPYPSGTDRRMIQSTLTFELPVWMGIPSEVKRDFIERIYVRVGAVGTGTTDPADMLMELDAQQIPYDTWADDSTIQM